MDSEASGPDAHTLLTTDEVEVGCPYCGERIRVVVDLSVAEQEYVEDCSVCCRPIVFRATMSGGSVELFARTEDE